MSTWGGRKEAFKAGGNGVASNSGKNLHNVSAPMQSYYLALLIDECDSLEVLLQHHEL